MIERRTTTNVTLRTDGGKIIGTASPTYDGTSGTEYELWDGTFERFAVGAFDDHLQSNPDVVALFNHDPNLVLGRTPNTLKLHSDQRGLHYEIDPPATKAAKDLQVLINRGDIRGSSFAFSPEEVEWQEERSKEIRLIKRAKVYDVSPVTTPAYSNSSVGLRSAEERKQLEKERDDYKARLETEKRIGKINKLLRK